MYQTPNKHEAADDAARAVDNAGDCPTFTLEPQWHQTATAMPGAAMLHRAKQAGEAADAERKAFSERIAAMRAARADGFRDGVCMWQASGVIGACTGGLVVYLCLLIAGAV